MAREAAIRLEGFEELSAAFNELERGVKAKILMPALKECADIIQASAKAKVPVRTGKLRDSIYVERLKGREGLGWAVKTGTRQQLGIPNDFIKKYGYYPFVIEYGGVRGGERQVIGRGRGRRRIVKGGRRIPARPFMRPAVDENRARCIGILAARMQEGIDRAVTLKSGKQMLATQGAGDVS